MSVWDFVPGHIISIAHKGKNIQDNLRPICETCNGNMGSSDWDDFVPQKPERLPERVFNIVTRETRLVEILTQYDPYTYGRSAEKYRIPNYQRHLHPPIDWCARLIESILENRHIGNITLSSWKEGRISYYNIEDGQTRLFACHRFMEGRFRCKYGFYYDPDVRERFDNYNIGYTEITRSRPNEITDDAFFTELCDNFSLLQEGKKLTNSEKFWTQMPMPSENFDGVALLRFTLAMVNDRFKKEFDEYYDLPSGFHRNDASEIVRGRLDTLVTICSGCIEPTMYKQNYIMHHRMMTTDYEIPHREEVIARLRLLFRAFDLGVEQDVPKRFIKSLSGPILHDIHESKEEEAFISLWQKVFTECALEIGRQQQIPVEHRQTPNDWMDKVVLNGLAVGKRKNYRLKLQTIRDYFQ